MFWATNLKLNVFTAPNIFWVVAFVFPSFFAIDFNCREKNTPLCLVWILFVILVGTVGVFIDNQASGWRVFGHCDVKTKRDLNFKTNIGDPKRSFGRSIFSLRNRTHGTSRHFFYFKILRWQKLLRVTWNKAGKQIRTRPGSNSENKFPDRKLIHFFNVCTCAVQEGRFDWLRAVI